MAQQRHNIDTTQSMTIIDADSFNPETGTPDKDNQRIGLFPTVAYEGKNVLPTDQGYKSFFGTKSVQDASGLPTNTSVQHIFVYQTGEYRNILVALTATGVFMREQGTAWEQVLALPAPAAGTDYLWTYAVVKNTVVMYRQDQAVFHAVEDYTNTASSNQGDWTGLRVSALNFTAAQVSVAGALASKRVGLVAVTPTTLNMAGQIGLFRAGGSIGFWDSADAVAWSSLVNAGDFTPSKTTLANITGFKDLVGKITAIHGFGDGFVVYATKSVVRVVENSSALQRFQADSVYTSIGVSYPRQVAAAQPDDIHFAWTNTGLMQLNKEQEPQIIVTEVGDYLRKSRQPVYLRYINNRYLILELTDKDIVFGNVEFSTQTVDPADVSYFPDNTGTLVDGIKVEGNNVCFTPDPEQPQAGVKPFVIAPILEGNLRVSPPNVEDNHTMVSPGAGLPACVPANTFDVTQIQGMRSATIRQAGKVSTGSAALTAFVDNQIEQFRTQQVAEFNALNSVSDQAQALQALCDAATSDAQARVLNFTWNSASDTTPMVDSVTGVTISAAILDGRQMQKSGTQVTTPAQEVLVWDKPSLSSIQDIDAVTGAEAYQIPINELVALASEVNQYHLYEITNYQSSTVEESISYFPRYQTDYFDDYTHDTTGATVSFPSSVAVQAKVRRTTQEVINATPCEDVTLTGVDAVLAKTSNLSPPSSPTTVLSWGDTVTTDTRGEDIPGYTYVGSSAGSTTTINATPEDVSNPGGFVAESYSRTATVQALPVVRNTLSSPINRNSLLAAQSALELAGAQPLAERAGLIAAETWWYSTNNHLTALDDQALVTPTLSLTTMEYGMTRAQSSVDADGAFANRYYTYTDADGNGIADSLEQKLVCGTVKPIDIPPVLVAPVQFQPWTIEIPELTWQLENGNKAPVDPTFTAALVYDTQLQKWGNMEVDYKQLVDYQPLTALDSNSAVTYENFVVDAGALLANRNTCIFSDDPTESYIRYGKYRHWPAGTTAIEEVNVNYADPSNGMVTVQTSYNGRQLEYGQSNSVVFTNALRSELGCDMVGKWHTITVSGQFNLTHIEVVSSSSGRR